MPACVLNRLGHVQLLATPWTLCTSPGSSVQGILQARILERVAIPSCRGSSPPRNQPVSLMPLALASGFFTNRTWEALQGGGLG